MFYYTCALIVTLVLLCIIMLLDIICEIKANEMFPFFSNYLFCLGKLNILTMYLADAIDFKSQGYRNC